MGSEAPCERSCFICPEGVENITFQQVPRPPGAYGRWPLGCQSVLAIFGLLDPLSAIPVRPWASRRAFVSINAGESLCPHELNKVASSYQRWEDCFPTFLPRGHVGYVWCSSSRYVYFTNGACKLGHSERQEVARVFGRSFGDHRAASLRLKICIPPGANHAPFGESDRANPSIPMQMLTVV